MHSAVRDACAARVERPVRIGPHRPPRQRDVRKAHAANRAPVNNNIAAVLRRMQPRWRECNPDGSDIVASYERSGPHPAFPCPIHAKPSEQRWAQQGLNGATHSWSAWSRARASSSPCPSRRCPPSRKSCARDAPSPQQASKRMTSPLDRKDARQRKEDEPQSRQQQQTHTVLAHMPLPLSVVTILPSAASVAASIPRSTSPDQPRGAW